MRTIFQTLRGNNGRVRMYRETVLGWVSSATNLLLGVARAKASALYLGATGIGLVAQFNFFSSWAAGIVSSGLGTGAIREISAARGRGDQDAEMELMQFVLIVPTAIALVATLIMIPLSGRLSMLLVGTQEYALGAAMAAIAIPFSVFTGAVNSIVSAHERPGRASVSAGISNLLTTVLVVVLILKLGIIGGLIGVVVSSVVNSGVVVLRERVLLRRVISTAWRPPRSPALRALAGIGITSLVLGTASSSGDLFIRGLLLRTWGIGAVGQYQPVFAVSSGYLLAFIGATAAYLMPRVSKLLHMGENGRASREMDAGIELALAVFTPAILGVMAGSLLLLKTLYSVEFVGAAPYLRVQLLGDILRVIAYSLGAALLPLNRLRSWSAIGLATVLANGGIALIAVPMLGGAGVALAYTTSWALNAGLTMLVIARSEVICLSRRTWILMGLGVVSVGAGLGAFSGRGSGPAVCTALSLAWVVYLVLRARHGGRRWLSRDALDQSGGESW